MRGGHSSTDNAVGTYPLSADFFPHSPSLAGFSFLAPSAQMVDCQYCLLSSQKAAVGTQNSQNACVRQKRPLRSPYNVLVLCLMMARVKAQRASHLGSPNLNVLRKPSTQFNIYFLINDKQKTNYFKFFSTIKRKKKEKLLFCFLSPSLSLSLFFFLSHSRESFPSNDLITLRGTPNTRP